MSPRSFQHEILSSRASVIRWGPVTCSRYRSLLQNITLTYRKLSRCKWQLSAHSNLHRHSHGPVPSSYLLTRVRSIIEHFILNVEGEDGHSLRSPCAWLCASYTGVKTSAFHHHTLKNKGWAPWTQNAEISWNETRPLATGNRAPQCPVSCKQEGKINLSLFSSAFYMIQEPSEIPTPCRRCYLCPFTHLMLL